MGLIYLPSDAQKLISNMNHNIASSQAIVSGLRSASKQLMSALSSGKLEGSVYRAGKSMFGQLVLPILEQAERALTHLKSDLSRFRTAVGVAGSELLHEDILNERLRMLQQEEQNIYNHMFRLGNLSMIHQDDPVLQRSLAYQQSQAQNWLNYTHSEVDKVREKLRKLYDFNGVVSGLFTDTADLLDISLAGANVVGSSVFGPDGTLSLSDTLENAGRKFELTKAVLIGIAGKKAADKYFGALKDATGKSRIKFEKGTNRVKWDKKYLVKEKSFSSKRKKLSSALDGYDLRNFKNLKGTAKSEMKSAFDVKSSVDFSGFKKGSSGLAKAGAAFKVAGWIGTGANAVESASKYKSAGYSNEQVAALTARNVAVETAASATGQTAGRIIGATFGAVGGPVGAAVGSVIGGVIGAAAGSWVGGIINDHFDKGVKPRKIGWSYPW
ncbi:hypothetical protein AALA52_06945 [Lactococcus ileimucosae]|uniref:LXG domain-containing protein n=1 Tax=Lactococcus ileimucosae TaxID=2941329 RepID=A0ABV4D541_9LACT